MRTQNTMLQESPTDKILKDLPKGDCNWPGYDHVRNKLSQACEFLAHGGTGKRAHTYLSYDHIYLMAVLGCGHEETMKYEMARAILNKWC